MFDAGAPRANVRKAEQCGELRLRHINIDTSCDNFSRSHFSGSFLHLHECLRPGVRSTEIFLLMQQYSEFCIALWLKLLVSQHASPVA
jgi:hypothetical protein